MPKGSSRKGVRRWTAEEDETLADCWPSMPAKDIAKLIDRSIPAIWGRVKSLGLFSGERMGDDRIWTMADDKALSRMIAARVPMGTIAARLGRTQKAIWGRRAKLGLPCYTRRLTVEQEAIIREAILSGQSIGDAAKLAECSKTGAIKACRRAGIKSQFFSGQGFGHRFGLKHQRRYGL